MKLVHAHIRTFRSIVDSGEIPLDEHLTVFVGKNEQGKTNILRAIELFNRGRSYSPNDLPNHIRPDLETQNPGKLEMLNLVFSIENDDLENLAKIYQNPSAEDRLSASKYFDGSYTFRILSGQESRPLGLSALDQISPEQKTRLETYVNAVKNTSLEHANRHQPFKENVSAIETLTADFLKTLELPLAEIDSAGNSLFTALKALPNSDEAIQKDYQRLHDKFGRIVADFKKVQSETPSDSLWQRIPKFVLHTSLDTVPDRVNLPQFVENPEQVSKGMWNLCRAAGVTLRKLKELTSSKNQADINSYEDYYKKTISGEISEYWTQERYTVHFDFVADTLHISISDSRYSNRIPPSDRSDGFRWYFSFYCNLASEVGDRQSKCILLDNPATDLHLDGQRDIMRYLDQKISSNSQVVYVTHSPAMIDPFRLDRVRIVERKGDERGTIVSMPSAQAYRSVDLLEPVRLAIGASLVSTLFSNDLNILVEGLQDKTILDACISRFGDAKTRERMLVNGSVAQSPNDFIVEFYQRTKLPFLVLIDADSAGRDIAKRLDSIGAKANTRSLKDFFPQKQGDFSIDDIFDRTDYHRAVRQAYPKHDVPEPPAEVTKVATYYEGWFKENDGGFKFSKKRVAEALATAIKTDTLSDGSKENLGRLVSSIEEFFVSLPTPAVASTGLKKP